MIAERRETRIPREVMLDGRTAAGFDSLVSDAIDERIAELRGIGCAYSSIGWQTDLDAMTHDVIVTVTGERPEPGDPPRDRPRHTWLLFVSGLLSGVAGSILVGGWLS